MQASSIIQRSRAEAVAPYARGLTESLRGELRGWALLAIGSLAVAGALALLLGLARAPNAQAYLPWDLATFFKTALVTHVVFSVVIWYLAILGALSVVSAARAGIASPTLDGMGRAGLWFAWTGSLMLLVPTLLNQGGPSLNNYVPVLIHPLYYIGLALLAVGVALPVLRLLAQPGRLGGPVAFGTAMNGLVYLVALACFVVAWIALPAEGDVANLNERLFWGGGHVLQFVNTGLMLVLWYVIAEQVFGAPPVSQPIYRLSMAALVLFVLPGPAFYAMYDVMGIENRNAFTELLWYGLTLPPVVLSLGLMLQAVRHRPLPWGDARFLALALSFVVFNIGGVMGFFLGVSDTRIPSHYHLVITGANLAMLGGFLVLFLPLLGRPLGEGRAVRVPFWLYAGGQMLWSVSMFLAGMSGVPRKTVGTVEQGLETIGQKVLLGLVGVGALIAVAGGVLFLALLLWRMLGRERTHG